MPKPDQIFKTVEEYFKDYKYVTNSHLRDFEFCKYLYQQKREGNVERLEKDYFIYGSAVDSILSGENVEEKIMVGTAPKGTVEELRQAIEIVEKEIAEREGEGKKEVK